MKKLMVIRLGKLSTRVLTNSKPKQMTKLMRLVRKSFKRSMKLSKMQIRLWIRPLDKFQTALKIRLGKSLIKPETEASSQMRLLTKLKMQLMMV